MANQWTSSGACEVGIGVRALALPEDYGMAGYSWIGKRGSIGTATLYARALSMRDSAGTIAVICIVDLAYPSLALTAGVARAIKQHAVLGRLLQPEQVMLLGTHTHTAPGHHQYNSFFRLFSQPLSARSLTYQTRWVGDLAGQITDAVAASVKDIVPGWVGIGQTRLWGMSSNRSIHAFWKGPDNRRWNEPGFPGNPVDGNFHDEVQKAVDPRVTTIVARVDGVPRAAFGWFSCHATALGPAQKTYDPDWPGHAVKVLEGRYTNFHAAVGLSASGDVSPLPPDGLDDPDRHQGEKLARNLGEQVALRMIESIDAPGDGRDGDLKIHACGGAWSPCSEDLDWEIGYPSLGGAEDGRSELHSCFPEGQRKTGPLKDPQDPKRPALGLVQDILDKVVLEVAPWHPWYRFVLGSHVLATVPGEATTLAAYQLEKSLLNDGIEHATILGYGGDYVGYFTTEGEYTCQHYEGSMTLYGRTSLSSLGAAIGGDCGEFVFPDFPRAASDEKAVRKIIQGLSKHPVLVTVPVGIGAEEQLFAVWIATAEEKNKPIVLQDRGNSYTAKRIWVADEMFKDLLREIAPEAGDAVLVASFSRVSPRRSQGAPRLKKNSGERALKCRDLRPLEPD